MRTDRPITPPPTPALASCGTFPIRIASDGGWWHEGRPIVRPEMVRLFASSLHADGAGGWWLVTPFERGKIEVEDCPFAVVALRVEGTGEAQGLYLRTTLDEWVRVDGDHPLRLKLVGGLETPKPMGGLETPKPMGGLETPKPVGGLETPVVLVRAGLWGRLNRAVYYELVTLALEQAGEEETTLWVWSAGIRFCLGRLTA